MTEEEKNNVAVELLKKHFFELAAKENMPNTPKITKELDKVQEAIKELTKAPVAKLDNAPTS